MTTAAPRRRPCGTLTLALAVVAVISVAGSVSASADAPAARDIAVLACPETEVVDPQFADVQGNVHRGAIECLATYGLASGTAPGTYSPGELTTRGQMATVAFRLLTIAGVPMTTADRGFTDIAGSPHAEHINAIASIRVVNGTTATTFTPTAPITRAQLAKFLVHTVVATGAFMEIGPDAFVDDDGGIHESYIDTLAHNGIAQGDGAGRFHPNDPVRRDALASFTMRSADFAIQWGGLRSPFSANHRHAELTPGQVATEEGGEADAEGRAELWTVGQPDAICFSIGATDLGSGQDHVERSAYLAMGPPGTVGEVLVELPPPDAANDVPPGLDSWSGGCVETTTDVVRRLIEDPSSLYVGLSTWEYDEALRGQLMGPAT